MVKGELHSIVSALVGGARYGVKIRLPHALVMTVLFRRDLSSKDKLKNILKLAYQHASSLAAFATIYKTILALLKAAHRKLLADQPNGLQEAGWKAMGRMLLAMIVDGPLPGERGLLHATHAPPGHPERIHHAFIAGAVGGYFVWGRYSSLNQQIILYLTSRVLVGTWKRLQIMQTPSSSNSLGGASSTTLTSENSSSSNRSFSLVAALVWAMVMALWEESPEVLHPSLTKSMDEIYRYALGGSSSEPLVFDHAEPPLESRVIRD